MKKPVLYVGIDVDDNSYHFSTLDIATGEYQSNKTGPRPEFLRRQFESLSKNYDLKICYEASYIGFSLYRRLTSWGFNCVVIAPSLIPQISGDRVKTDRLDSLKLARYYAAGMLTTVHIPSEEEETHKRLLRSRKFFVGQTIQIKNRITGLCRALGWDYKKECNKENYWTQAHVVWLKEKISECSDNFEKFNFETLLESLFRHESTLESIDQKIEMLCESDNYKKKVQALRAYRSIDSLSALTIVTEIGDIKRFPHPKKLTSYAGLDIAEYSSGGNERKMSITKLGNGHLRRTLVEACQTASNPVRINKDLARRRVNTDKSLIHIADKCMARLHKKSWHLKMKNKHHNKVKVACARELLSFIWESLNFVEGELNQSR